MEKIYNFLMDCKKEKRDIRVMFDIPSVWPSDDTIVCRVRDYGLMRERNFILTPSEFPFISEILQKAYKEIIENTYVDDLRRFFEKGE